MEENHSPLVIQIAKQYSPTFRVLALHGSWECLLTGVKGTDWRDEKCVEILFLFLVIQTVQKQSSCYGVDAGRTDSTVGDIDDDYCC